MSILIGLGGKTPSDMAGINLEGDNKWITLIQNASKNQRNEKYLMMNRTFDFHGTKMTVKVLTSETNDRYTIIDAIHPPNVGPALHIHPRGPETFFIIEGNYEFVLDTKPIKAKTGDVISIPKGIPHRFVVGSTGGRVLIISPPELEYYFSKVSELLVKDKVTWETESDIAKQYGQIFIDNVKHLSQIA